MIRAARLAENGNWGWPRREDRPSHTIETTPPSKNVTMSTSTPDSPMNSEIVALRCPSCGNADSINTREIHYGYEFTCKHCRTTSVLIINRELYVRRPGDHVCTACGRVAPSQARFCQCRAPLVRKCYGCGTEFPADHSICDFCGMPVVVDDNYYVRFR